jgi:hypothetical protein
VLTAGVGHACELTHVLPLAQVAGQAAAMTAEAGKKTTECNVQWSGKGGVQQTEMAVGDAGLQLMRRCRALHTRSRA